MMSIRIAAALLVLVSPLAHFEETFGSRVQRAKLVEDSPEGKAYQERLWKQIGNETAAVMQQCFPKGVHPETDRFTLIADVLPSCLLTHIDVRPATKMAACFANGFGKLSFPQPPEGMGPDGIPLVIEMKITP